MVWWPLAFWAGRSDLQRVEIKRRVIRQDIARLGIKTKCAIKTTTIEHRSNIGSDGFFSG